MPKQKDLKRIVRSRMQKTGESYTAARLQVLQKKPSLTLVPDPPPDYAKLAGMADASLQKATGKPWAEWVSILDAVEASKWEHRDIAAHLHEIGVRDWWAQTVAVGYERIRGLRAIGQRRGGSWEASKSRTFNVPVAKLFAFFVSAPKRKRWLAEKITVRTTILDKSVRASWSDGTLVQFYFTPKGEAKTAVAIQHVKLASKQQADEVRSFWSERLGALAAIVKG